jgi:hypothetical protein
VKRLYFLLPNLESARRSADDLLLARVDDRHMHFLARRGTDLGDLREASYLQKSDVKHSAFYGLMLGGVCGLLLGAWMVLSPPEGIRLELVTVLASSLGGAFFGAWAASMVGASVPNSSLSKFAKEVDEGKVLLMVDVPRGRVDEMTELVHRRHPEADSRGVEPTMPAFP